MQLNIKRLWPVKYILSHLELLPVIVLLYALYLLLLSVCEGCLLGPGFVM